MSFAWAIAKSKLGKQRFLFIFLITLVAVISLISFFVLPHSSNKEPDLASVPAPNHSELYIKETFSPEEVDKQLNYWLDILETQPSHRDVLINISQLYRVRGDESKAVYYWEQARKADPNNILFK